jgi:hypothetical protein
MNWFDAGGYLVVSVFACAGTISLVLCLKVIFAGKKEQA